MKEQIDLYKGHWAWCLSGNIGVLCIDRLPKYFDLHKDDKRIRVTFSTKKSKDAHWVEVYKGGVIVGEGKWYEDSYLELDNILRWFPKRGAWVSLEVLG